MKFFPKKKTDAQIIAQGSPRWPVGENASWLLFGLVMGTAKYTAISGVAGLVVGGATLALGVTSLATSAVVAGIGLGVPLTLGLAAIGGFYAVSKLAVMRYDRQKKSYDAAVARQTPAPQVAPSQAAAPAQKEAAPDFNAAQKPAADTPANTTPRQAANKDKPKPPAAP